jgi:hypothetical protein
MEISVSDGNLQPRPGFLLRSQASVSPAGWKVRQGRCYRFSTQTASVDQTLIAQV